MPATPTSCRRRSQFRRWVKVALEQDVQMALRIVDEIEGAR